MLDFNNKKILVTGASSGIGKTVALMLSEMNAKLVIVGRSEERLKETYHSLHGEGHQYYVFDLLELSKIENLIIESVTYDNQKFYGMVHAAGISGLSPLRVIDQDKIDKIMKTNTYSFIHLLKAFSKKKYNCGRGSVVVVSSLSTLFLNEGDSLYIMSKAALEGFTSVMVNELSSKKIRLNAVLPGPVKTRMWDGAFIVFKNVDLNEGVLNPENIAAHISFLLSEKAEYINGARILLDQFRFFNPDSDETLY